MSTTTKKEPHIEGLRCLSIVFIMLFHLNRDAFPNGYYGVEVFFVIFGYFLVKKPIWNTNGSVYKESAAFIKKKIRRLCFPVSVIVLIVCASGCLFFSYDEWLVAAKTGLYTLLGFSNEYLNTLAKDYFALTTDFNPLFHLWYISVTVQSILLYICFCIFTYRRSKLARGVIAGAIAICSLLLFHRTLLGNTDDSPYYETIPRLWQIMTGACIAFLPVRRISCLPADIISLVCFAILLFFMSSGTILGNAAIPIVLSAATLIYVLPYSRLRHFVACKPAKLFGGVSFAFYLVHVPVYVWYRCWDMSCGYLDQRAMFALAIAAGFIFHYLVTIRKPHLRTICMVCACAMGASGCIIATNGFKHVINVEANNISEPTYVNFKYCRDTDILRGMDPGSIPSSDCVFDLAYRSDLYVKDSIALLEMGDLNCKHTFLLLGDSYAQMMYFGLNEYSKSHKLRGVLLSYRFPVIRDWGKEILEADAANLLSWLKDHKDIETVIIGQSWKGKMCFRPEDYVKLPEEKTKQLKDFLVLLKKMGKKTIIITQLPLIREESIARYVRRCKRIGQHPDESKISCNIQQFNSINGSIDTVLRSFEQEGLCRLVHLESKLLQEGKIYGYKDGLIYYHDSEHLNPLGSMQFVEAMQDELNAVLKGNDTP